MPSDYEAVIGLEVHAQLSTESKMFCSCAVAFGGAPNSRTCPVCLGLPGALPVANRRAVEYAVRVGLAAHCEIARASVFARKNYFYPDCPKNYQITQYDTPLCVGGHLELAGRRVRLTRIHLEEDAGKLIHPGDADETWVDMNRAGVPLIEIVTEPDLRAPREAGDFLRGLRSILRYLDVCDGNMEEGSLRCDANVSVRWAGEGELGVKTEVKNLNSFKQVEQALAFEVERQSRLLEAGVVVEQDTLLWDPERGEAVIMRSKEEAQDYRYFPDPDLPVLVVDAETVASIDAALPELPAARAGRFVSQYGLPAYDAGVLTAAREIADYFEAVVAAGADAKAASNWVMGDVMHFLGEREATIDEFPITPGRLAELVGLQSNGAINSSTAREVFAEMLSVDDRAGAIVAAKGLEQISDDATIEAAVRSVLDAHPDEVERYRRGKKRLLQFFVGLVMKETRGKANPAKASELLVRLLER